jgi:hypothetical protein
MMIKLYENFGQKLQNSKSQADVNAFHFKTFSWRFFFLYSVFLIVVFGFWFVNVHFEFLIYTPDQSCS